MLHSPEDFNAKPRFWKSSLDRGFIVLYKSFMMFLRMAGLPLVALIFSFCSVFTTFAQTWTVTNASTNNWSAIACSADGSKIYASAGGGVSEFGFKTGLIYKSVDGGLLGLQLAHPAIIGPASLVLQTELKSQLGLAPRPNEAVYTLRPMEDQLGHQITYRLNNGGR
jgi:hypothetical protein